MTRLDPTATVLTRSSVIQRSTTMTNTLKRSLRILPVAVLLAGFGASALPAGATGSPCPPAGRAHVSIDAPVQTSTTVNASADGGTATASSNGGSHNTATAGGFLFGGTASAGNGGPATADASGGTVTIDSVSGGTNSGATISVDDTSGGSAGGSASVEIAAPVVTSTTVNASANGGTATASSNGGSDNSADAGFGGSAQAGNGGPASADASGGTVTIGAVDGGDNTGPTITVDDTQGN